MSIVLMAYHIEYSFLLLKHVCSRNAQGIRKGKKNLLQNKAPE